MSSKDKPKTARDVEAELASALRSPHGGDVEADATRARLATQLFGKAFEPARVGRFVLLARVGAGAMGVVHAGYDETLDRKVAIKLIGGGDAGSTDARPRMLREAQALARLSHPNVVQIYEAGMHEGQLFIAMEFVQGQTLRGWARAGDEPRPWREVVDAYVQAARGLAAAHEAGLVHRDFKPDNAMIDAAGQVRVMDFGLARGLAEQDPGQTLDDLRPAHSSGGGELATPLTRSGVLVGTPVYMAPEQLAGREASAHSDQFSFCVSMWEALHTERPFTARSLAALAQRMNEGPPSSPRADASIPRRVRDALERGLSADPSARWPSMEHLVAALTPPAASGRGWWLGGAALAMGGLAVAGWLKDEPQLCAGAADALAEVWDAQRRDAVRSGILGTELSYAPGVWERTSPALEAWTDRWVQMHTDACEATRVAGDQSAPLMDLRMACLNRARRGLDAAATVLAEATPDTVRSAHTVIEGLPRIERCADLEALQADVEPPPDAESEAVEAIRTALADAEALRNVGRYDDALAAVRRAEARAEGLSYAPIHAEVDLQLGYALDEGGDYDDAEAAMRSAAERSARTRQREVLRDATLGLVFVLGSRQQRPSEALALREVAAGLAAGTPEAEADAHHRFAEVFHAQGKLAEAEAEHRAALQIRDEQLGAEHPDVAMSRSALAATLLDQGKFEEALTQQRAALESRTAALGSDHPLIANARNTLAEILSSQGKYAEAEAEHRRALQVRRAALGETHPDVANSRTNLGTVLDLQGKHVAAEAEHRAALALLLDAVGADHPHVGRVRNNLATSLHAQGKLEEAEGEQRAVLAHLQETLGREHPAVATARNNLANVLTSQGKLAAAEQEYRAALALIAAAMGPEHPDVALLRNNVAYLLRQQGKDADAATEYRAVLALREKVLEPDHPNIAHSRLALANTLTKLGKPAEALPLLRAAWALHERAPIPDSLAAMAAFNLAKALRGARTEPERAEALARQALGLYESAGDAKTQAEVEAWLEDGASG